MEDGVAPMITIRPFTQKTNFYFKAKGHFLKKKEVLDLLDKESVSWSFMRKQEMLPLQTLRKMITIDRSEIRKNIRHVRLYGKKKQIKKRR